MEPSPLPDFLNRVPKVKTLINRMESSDEMEKIREHSRHLSSEFMQASLLDMDMWQLFLNGLVKNLNECLAEKESQLTVRNRAYLICEFTLLEWIMCYNEEEICNEMSVEARDERRCALYSLGGIVSQAFNSILAGGQHTEADVSKVAEEMMATIDFEPLTETRKENLYYISGWWINAASKEGQRRRGKKEENATDTASALIYFASSSRVVVNHGNLSTIANSLPTGKIDRVMAFDGLTYPTMEWYEFTCRVEKVFENLFTVANLMVYGEALVRRVRSGLESNPTIREIIQSFLPDDTSTETLESVIHYIFRTYSRMRGKDFARKIMSKTKSSLSIGTRHTMAVMSDGTKRAKKPKTTSKTTSSCSSPANHVLEDEQDERSMRELHTKEDMEEHEQMMEIMRDVHSTDSDNEDN
eukprot:scaffold421221_cov91-Attheya_sp.AAC.1